MGEWHVLSDKEIIEIFFHFIGKRVSADRLCWPFVYICVCVFVLKGVACARAFCMYTGKIMRALVSMVTAGHARCCLAVKEKEKVAQ